MPLETYRPGLPGTRPVESTSTTGPLPIRAPTPTAQPVQPGVITPTTTTTPMPVTPNNTGKVPVQYTPSPTPNPLFPEPTTVTPRPLYPEPNVTPRPLYPEPFNVSPRPLYPEPSGPNMGIPGGPGSLNPGPGNANPYNPVPGVTNANPYAPPSSYSPGNVVTDNLNNLLASDGAYMTNARQRGLEQAASRGMLNSSIAAGTSQRAALEAAQPILSNIMGLTSQRESQAFSSSEAQRERQFQAEYASMNAQLQDWMANNQFNRNFNGQLAMMPIASAADMWSGLMQLAASDPTVFTPDVLAGYQDFFQTGFDEYISRYLQPPSGG